MVEEINTLIGKLANLVFSSGEISSKEAAAALGINEKQVEEWVDVLEKHSIISVEYTTLHGIMLRAKALSKSDFKEKLSSISKEISGFEKGGSEIERNVAEFDVVIPKLSNDLELLEKEIASKLSEVGRATSMINDLGCIKDDFAKKVKKVAEDEKEALAAEKRLQEAEKSIEEAFVSAKKATSEAEDKLLEVRDSINKFKEDLKRISGQKSALGKELNRFKKKTGSIAKLGAKASGLKEGDKKSKQLSAYVAGAEATSKGMHAKTERLTSSVKELEGKLSQALKAIHKQKPKSKG